MKGLEHRYSPSLMAPTLILAALVCLISAWVVPVVRGKIFFIFPVHQTMLDVLSQLIADGDHLVAGILLAFAFVVPAMKLMIMLLCWVWLRIGLRLPEAVLNLVDAIGRWAMLDVFVAALFVVTLKLKGVPGQATTGTAITLLVLAFAFSTAASWLLKRGSAKRAAQLSTACCERKEPTFSP